MSYFINEEIKAKEVKVINENGEMLGEKSIKEAIEIAYNAGYDLVEINSNSTPPLCKVMDYKKYLFEQGKKEKLNKQKNPIIKTKEIRMRPGIDKHDIDTKLKSTLKFLQDGNKVKVVVYFSGREMAHTEIGEKVLNDFIESCGDSCIISAPPKLDGKNYFVILNPKT